LSETGHEDFGPESTGVTSVSYLLKYNPEQCSNRASFQQADVFRTVSIYSHSFLSPFQKPAPHLFPCFCLLPYPIIMRLLSLPFILFHTQRPFLLDCAY